MSSAASRPANLYMGTGDCLHNAKIADISPPSSAEFKNGGAIPPLPHTSSARSTHAQRNTTRLFSYA
jgi:hypothetical protein